MRKVLVVIASLGVAGAALVLASMLAVAGPDGCPTALLEGTLVEQSGTLAVKSAFDGTAVAVRWPFGYGGGEENGTLTLTRVFATVAREGDTVSMGGGEGGAGVFAACGPVAVGLELRP